MTKEKIEQKAKELYPDEHSCKDDFTRQMRQSLIVLFRKCFVEGANWALSHQWVRVEDELPPVGNVVIVRNKYGCLFAAHYSEKFDNFTYGAMTIADVTHWMPIPPLAEEGGNNERKGGAEKMNQPRLF